jgi:hypothetical protein
MSRVQQQILFHRRDARSSQRSEYFLNKNSLLCALSVHVIVIVPLRKSMLI